MIRTIWMLWFQGFDKAPPVVHRCVESWKHYNPDWKIIFLDHSNLDQYINVNYIIATNAEYITPQAYANVIRANLLKTYGGVWVDVSIFCTKSLDEWLCTCMASGFFAFRNPGKDRVMANWFMAAAKDNELMQILCERINVYWTENKFSGMQNKFMLKLRRYLVRLLNVNTTRTAFWFSRIVRKGLRIFPYFWFHYLFSLLARTEKQFGAIWRSTPDFAAGEILEISRADPGIVRSDIQDSILNRKTPMYKLSWRKIQKEGGSINMPLELLYATHEVCFRLESGDSLQGQAGIL